MSPTLVAEYRYNGLGQRISESDGTDTEYFIYDDSWQLISRHDGTAYTEEILYHHAGLDGLGGSCAMDSVILRRTYLTTGSPQTEDKRWYILQNWRNDPVVTLTDAGVEVERVRFSPYGEAFGIPSGDLDFNGEATLLSCASWAIAHPATPTIHPSLFARSCTGISSVGNSHIASRESDTWRASLYQCVGARWGKKLG